MRWTAVALTALLFICNGAIAGRSCTDTPLTPESVRKGLLLAYKTFQVLDQTDARIALIGRIGSDLSRHNLRYSHMGMVVRDHAKGRWIVVHMLNSCGTATSALYDEGLGNFFNDDPFAYETIIVIPGEPQQEQLLKTLTSAVPVNLYHNACNMVAYPWSAKYQNSNQWVLEVLAAAWAPSGNVSNRQQAQAWLKQTGYQPTLLKLGALERLGGRMFRANVAFDDHPNELRYSNQIYTVTVESIIAFVKRLDGKVREITLKLD